MPAPQNSLNLPQSRHTLASSSSLQQSHLQSSLRHSKVAILVVSGSMRIRRGHRLADHHQRATASAPEDDGGKKVRDINEIVGGAAAGGQRADVLVASASGALLDVDPQRGGDDDPGRKRLSGEISDGVGVLSISSIIQAGKGSNSASPPASAESAVTISDHCSRASAAMESDQPGTLLLQSLRRVFAAAGSAGLTPKEAVARITEQGLPGLHDGGERLIVQVAKSFRASSLFAEERGRYFIMQRTSSAGDMMGADNSSASSEAIEAAKQLQNLQSTDVGLEEKVIARIKQAKVSSSASEPRCNRDDGKGWRCIRPAEPGYSLCKYHRDQIRRAESRRRRARNKSIREEMMRASNPSPPKAEALNTDIAKTVDAESEDDELPDLNLRRAVKAKSLKSIL